MKPLIHKMLGGAVVGALDQWRLRIDGPDVFLDQLD